MTRRPPRSTPFPYTTLFRSIIVSATVHVFSVCGTVMLKNSLISQNPASFTCESISEPAPVARTRSEEHTSELQSLTKLVCRLLLEKKNKATHKNEPHLTGLT